MGGQEKAKLLCSFGGEIIRKHGKPFYLGGKTRLVTIQRSSSFRSLLSKMSKLCDADPNSVELKYQLPDVSLDSRMISIENDDDVSNMMDDFDIDRKIPIFLFTNNRGRSSGEEEEEDEEEIADEDDVLDSVGMDGLSFEAVVAARESIRSKSSSGRDSVRYPSVGSSVSREVFHKDSQSLVVGQEYEDVQSFRNALTSAAIAANFELHMIRSDQRRVTARCAAEGCTWRVHASKLPQVNTFRIRTLTPDHTCIRSEYAGHRQATAKWIANCIREKLRQNRNYRPREIVNDIHRDYGVLITYKRAFLGREKALEELRFEPVLDVEPIEKNVYEPIMGNMDALTWGEIHDPPRKKRAFCEPCQSKEVRPLHCTRCNQTGHNRRTCDVLELVQGEGNNNNNNDGKKKGVSNGKDKDNNNNNNNNNGVVDKRFKTLPPSEALPRSEAVGGYIFVCNNDTMQENLKRQLFGLPPRYRDSVRAITPGLPLFLYNYSTHQLHGIFEAASFGGTNIDPTAWEDKKSHGESRFPAQVKVMTRKICEPLEEDSFRPILHHYDGPKFRLELSVPEALALLDIFAENNV